MEAWTYLYQKGYGSPETEKITVSSVSEAGKSVLLKVEPMTIGHIHALKLDGVKNEAGHQLLHRTGYYTLNEIPKQIRVTRC